MLFNQTCAQKITSKPFSQSNESLFFLDWIGEKDNIFYWLSPGEDIGSEIYILTIHICFVINLIYALESF